MRRTPLLFLGLMAALAHGAEPKSPWSFAPIREPVLPVVQTQGWCRQPIDRFILGRLEAAGLPPGRDADRSTLLRRVSFDLTGLPPTPVEIAAFLRDPAPDDAALAKVVDRLLASPRYGERWGRHWLDVVHYADSVGRTWNAPFVYAWRYRDWVIDSFNADKNFALFAAEQIAGDLLPARTAAEKRSRLIGTGLLALSALPLPESGSEAFALDRVDDQIDVTTRAFLGLTVSCARCHDHKTDPIRQRDYYALAGIFYSSQTLSGGRRGSYVDTDFLLKLPGRTAAVEEAGMDAKGFYRVDPDLAMGLSEGEPRNCAIRLKGDAQRTGETPARGDWQVPGLPRLEPVSGPASGRLELARWLVSPANPLTARVMVNRVWAHLFGRGLVASVDDFGLTGEPPSAPELLDFLAARFASAGEGGCGWSVKKLARMLVLSRAYRQSSFPEPRHMAVDAANRLLWRMPPRRLELEAIRDAMLQVAGNLSLQRPSGIPVAGNGGKGKVGMTRALLNEMATCRTVYLPVLRDLLPELYRTFDFPEPTQIKGEREVTTVPAQDLFFLNSRFSGEVAARAAGTLLEETSLRTPEARIGRAYELVLGREPGREELAEARAFLDAPLRWPEFLQALMASAEFRYLW